MTAHGARTTATSPAHPAKRCVRSSGSAAPSPDNPTRYSSSPGILGDGIMMLDATDARDGRVPLAPGSSPTGQAPTGLAASRYDPSRGQSPSRVLVCGGRDYSDAVFVCKVLDQHGPTTIITGDARGADEHARNWARQNANLESYAADWKAHGRAAGPIRNQQMLVEGKPDLVIAFPGGRGTADMVRRAKAAGVWCLDLSDSDTRRMAETSIGSVRSTGSAGRKASHDPDSQHARNMGEM